MVKLMEITTELLDELLSYLPHQDLLSIACVCHRLRNLSTPFIYKNINLLGRGERVHLLLRTLLSQPQLAVHIQHFELSSWLKSLDHSRLKLSFKEQEIVEAWLISTDFLSEEEKECGSGLIKSGQVDIEVAMLLSRLSNLKSLKLICDCPEFVRRYSEGYYPGGRPWRRLEPAGPKFSPYTLKLLQRKVIESSENIFPSLHSVEFGADGEGVSAHWQPRLSLNQALPCFYIPNLESLTLSQLETKWDSLTWARDSRPQLSSLTHLALEDTALSEDALVDILRACPNIKRFEYDYHGNFASVREGYFHCSKAMEALNHISSTLEHLMLDVDIGVTMAIDLGDSGAGPVGTMSFKNFPRLQTLHIPIAVLLGAKADMTELPDVTELADVLPNSLKKLTITGQGWWTMVDYNWWPEEVCRYMTKYVSSKLEGQSENLEAIEIWYGAQKVGQGDWWPRGLGERLLEASKAAGVRWENINIGGYFKG